MNHLAVYLAAEAKRLGLGAVEPEDASPEQLQEFARAVLAELSARGLLQISEEVGCWAAPRSGQH